MLTPFGKAVRMLRIEKGVRLKDMAEKLKVTSAYVSGLETGKKAVPPKLVVNIAKYFELGEEQQEKLESLAADTRKNLKLSLNNTNKGQRELATTFARRFDELSQEDIDKMMTILKKHCRE